MNLIQILTLITVIVSLSTLTITFYIKEKNKIKEQKQMTLKEKNHITMLNKIFSSIQNAKHELQLEQLEEWYIDYLHKKQLPMNAEIKTLRSKITLAIIEKHKEFEEDMESPKDVALLCTNCELDYILDNTQFCKKCNEIGENKRKAVKFWLNGTNPAFHLANYDISTYYKNLPLYKTKYK